MPPAGVGAVTLSVQRITYTGHLMSDGSLFEAGQSVDASLFVEAEYALTDRVLVSVGLPFVGARYTDPNPPPPFAPALAVDLCRCWHTGFQDWSFAAHYSLMTTRGFALTPSIVVGIPSHDYNYRGEAALGRDLKEVRFGANVGQRLDAVSSKLSIQGSYSYSVVEQVLDIPNNRSNAAIEGAFQMTRTFGVRAAVAWQHTHGGLRFGSLPPSTFVLPGEVNTSERLAQHDRLLRDNHVHYGGGASYSLHRFDVFGSWIQFGRGTDAHAGHVLTAGISVPFESAPLVGKHP